MNYYRGVYEWIGCVTQTYSVVCHNLFVKKRCGLHLITKILSSTSIKTSWPACTVTFSKERWIRAYTMAYKTSRIRHQCRKTTVLSCQICLINTGVDEQHLNIDYRQELWPPEMSLSKCKCWYSKNCLHFLKGAVPFKLPNQGTLTEGKGSVQLTSLLR